MEGKTLKELLPDLEHLKRSQLGSFLIETIGIQPLGKKYELICEMKCKTNIYEFSDWEFIVNVSKSIKYKL